MKKIGEQLYKNINITTHIDQYNHFHCTTHVGFNSFNSNVHNGGYPTFLEALTDIQSKINAFLITTPTNYEELAREITSSLVWTGYEDCHVDVFKLQILIENFNKTQSK